MFKLDVGLSVLILAFTPVPALIRVWAASEQTERERVLLERWSSLYSRFNEVLTGILTVKSFARESEKERFLHGVRYANDVVVRGIGIDSAVGASKSLAVTLARLSALGYGGFLVIEGSITVGTLLAFLAYIGGIFGPVQGLTNVYQTIRTASVSMETIFEILDAEDPVADRPDARPAPVFRGDVEFQDVYFAYERGRSVFRELNLSVQAGQRVALVGPSGGGKTTLMVLLQRLCEPQAGSIRIDGIDIREFTQKSLHKQLGIVPQDVLLFNDSIADNIAYGRPDATQEEIEAAARAANAHDFITALSEGYQTLAGERGNLLSVGQR